ncbi:uroporphyrinogen-III synthase [Calidifontibacter sp. DB0510]|uniref:Uroporphyrinogen-III synthase n=1 Tax=Metallococcus carri TaxID=1656884 RepID=A0A967B7R2_9MICO|nr:uroporphyrinogen-III synthase [Metallococcus carri]NHN57132.1 uroporphyrinogen-III synthase [Metallococcus carri]NOP38999.1 uroporphyrinogen-III synthase [Calidifontibacter sp. DB2511S]
MNPVSDQLAGCRIVLTAQRRSAELAAALERRGAEVVHAAALSIVPHVDDRELLARTRELVADQPDVIVVTTGAGLTGWIEAADAAGLGDELHDVLAGARIVARGPKARGAVQAAGLTADWVAESETNAEVRDYLLQDGVAGQRIAVQHHGSGSDGVDEALVAAGATVVPLVVYRWGPAPDPAALAAGVVAVAQRECDAVVFTSAPGVQAFLDAAAAQGLLDQVVAAMRQRVVAAAVGAITAQPLQDKGIAPLVPDRYRLGALVRALVTELAEHAPLTVPTTAGELRILASVALLDGQPLVLSPTSLAVLRLIAQARGAVVSRAEILSALPGQSTDLHAAEVAVARLRDAIPRELVSTVVKRGYRVPVLAEDLVGG